MEYTHKGIKIRLDEAKGDFVAAIAGKESRAPSLAAMKTRIDKNKDSFAPFGVLSIEDEGYFNAKKWKVARYQVTGIRVSGRATKYSQQQCGYATDNNRVLKEVILDTPKNRAIAEQIVKHHTETQRIDKQRTAEYEKLDESLERRACPQKES